MSEQKLFSNKNTSGEISPHSTNGETLPISTVEGQFVNTFDENVLSPENEEDVDQMPFNEDEACFSEDDMIEFGEGVEKEIVKKVVIDSDSDDEWSERMMIQLADHTYDARSPRKRYQKERDAHIVFKPIPGLAEFFQSPKSDNRQPVDSSPVYLVSQHVNRSGFENSANVAALPSVHHQTPTHRIVGARSDFTPVVATHQRPQHHPTLVPRRLPMQGSLATQRPPHNFTKSSNSSNMFEPMSPQHTAARDLQNLRLGSQQDPRIIQHDGQRRSRSSFSSDASPNMIQASNAPMVVAARGNRPVSRGRGVSTSSNIRREETGVSDDLIPEHDDGMPSIRSPSKQVHFADRSYIEQARGTELSSSTVRTNRLPPRTYSPTKSTVIPPHRGITANGGANAPMLVRNVPRTNQAYVVGPSNVVSDQHDMPDNLIDQGPERPVLLKDSALPPNIAEIAADLCNESIHPATTDSSDNNEMKAKIQAIMIGLKKTSAAIEQNTSGKGRPTGNIRSRNSASTSSSNLGTSPRQMTSPPRKPDHDGPFQRTPLMRPPGSSPPRTNVDFNSSLSVPISSVLATSADTVDKARYAIPVPSLQNQDFVGSTRRVSQQSPRRSTAKGLKQKALKRLRSPDDESENNEEGWIYRCICEMTHDTLRMIECGKCNAWQHSECLGMSVEEFTELSKPDAAFFCEQCVPRQLSLTPMEAKNLQRQYLNQDGKGKKQVTASQGARKTRSSDSKIKLPKPSDVTKRLLISSLAKSLLRDVDETILILQNIPETPLCLKRYVACNIEGMVAQNTIQPDEVVCELFGNVLLPSEYKRNKSGETTSCFLYDGLINTSKKKSSSICLDMRKKDDIIRRSCRPNCVIKHSLENNKLRLFLVSTQEIEKISELCVPFDADTVIGPSVAKHCTCSTDQVKREEDCLFLQNPCPNITLGHLQSSSPRTEVKVIGEVPEGDGQQAQDTSVSLVKKELKAEIKEEKSEEESLAFPKISEGEEVPIESKKRGRPSKKPCDDASVTEEILSTKRRSSHRVVESNVIQKATLHSTELSSRSDRTLSIREERKMAETEKLFAKQESSTKEKKTSLSSKLRRNPGEHISVDARKAHVQKHRDSSSRKRKAVNDVKDEKESDDSSIPSTSSRTPTGRKKEWIRRYEADNADTPSIIAAEKDVSGRKRRNTREVASRVDNTSLKGSASLRMKELMSTIIRDTVADDFHLPSSVIGSLKPSSRAHIGSKVAGRSQMKEEPRKPQVREEPRRPRVKEEPRKPQVKEEAKESHMKEELRPQVKEEPREPQVREEATEEVIPEVVTRKERRLTIEEYRMKKAAEPQIGGLPKEIIRTSPRKRGFIPSMDNLEGDDHLPPIPLPLESQKKGPGVSVQAIGIDELKRQVLHQEASTSVSSQLCSPRTGEPVDDESDRPMSVADRLKSEWGINKI